mmetsp:Transcript_55572/g.130462  ORF Transcript_55572/g.130462 Transcript_55572/m.130462 type:complete len:96 (+) Transcript_55572:540-827(+)
MHSGTGPSETTTPSCVHHKALVDAVHSIMKGSMEICGNHVLAANQNARDTTITIPRRCGPEASSAMSQPDCAVLEYTAEELPPGTAASTSCSILC